MIEQIKLNIKREIKARNKTTEEVCKAMNKDRRYIYYMTNEVKLLKVAEIAKAIGCNIADLLTDLK